MMDTSTTTTLLPNSSTPWHFSSSVFKRISQQPSNDSFKTVEIQTGDPEFAFIQRYFQQNAPANRAIAKVWGVHNWAQTSAFESSIPTMEQEASNSTFSPKWESKSDPLNPLRQKAYQRWEEATSPFSPFYIPEKQTNRTRFYQSTKVLPMWHGSSAEKCLSICKSGFAFFGKHKEGVTQSTDDGFFGSGIYFTNSARYAADIYSDGQHLLLAWVSMRTPYPVVSDKKGAVCSDMKALEGQGAYENYNAHYVPVVSVNPKDPKCAIYYPCAQGENPTCDELVVFRKSQTLLSFWVEICVDIPQPLPITQTLLQALTPSSLPFDSNALLIKGHTERVDSVTFSPGGQQLVSGSFDNTIRFWDVSSGKETTVLTAHTGSIESLVFSPNGHLLASGSWDKTIHLWDASSHKVVSILKGHTRGVGSLAFSPGGEQLASGSEDSTIRLWDVSSCKETAVLKEHAGRVYSVAFDLDGQQLASGSHDNTIRLWDAFSGKGIAVLTGHTEYVSSVAFNPANRQLASGSHDNTIRLWNVSSGKEISLLTGHTSTVYNIAFSPNGYLLASASFDNTIRLWNAFSGKEIAVLTGHTHWVWSIAFSPDGRRLASGSRDHTIRQWDLNSYL